MVDWLKIIKGIATSLLTPSLSRKQVNFGFLIRWIGLTGFASSCPKKNWLLNWNIYSQMDVITLKLFCVLKVRYEFISRISLFLLMSLPRCEQWIRWNLISHVNFLHFYKFLGAMCFTYCKNPTISYFPQVL